MIFAVLQQQMGDPPTGVLTTDQFSRLSQASDNIDRHLIVLPPRGVSMVLDDAVFAEGTRAGDNVLRPINFVRISCFKARGTCEEYMAWLTPDDQINLVSLFLTLGDEYRITSWSSSRVTAELQVPCFTALMTLDIKAQQVTTVTVPPRDASICTAPDPPTTWKFHPMTWKLVDGREVAEKFTQEKMNKARKLVYPAARALLPVQN
jgi:hypothetical protein